MVLTGNKDTFVYISDVYVSSRQSRSALRRLYPIALFQPRLCVIFLSLLLQLYLIAMVWSCYRYLLLRQGGRGSSSPEPEPVATLPDYEAALTDPRFSKVDLASYPTPPPSYDAATSDGTRGGK